jgi:arylsulfatase A-like enzyme
VITRRGFAGLLGAAALGARTPAPPVGVLVVAEQFRQDYLDRYEHLLGPGGFRRLMAESAWFTDCRMAAGTFSSSGVATLATGAWPEVHGIVADRWFDAETGEARTASWALLLAPTLCEAAAVSLRPLAMGASEPLPALFMGRAGHPLVQTPGEVAPPDWLSKFRDAHDPKRHRNAPWEALLAPAGAPPMRVIEDNPQRPGEFEVLYRSSPFALATEAELLRSAVRGELLAPDAEGPPALLFSVWSAPAALGYEVGADSPLMREMVLHMDREIARTLEFLDRQIGPDQYLFAFTAAHGAPSLPPPRRRAALTITGETVARAIDRALGEAFDPTGPARNRYVERYVYPFVYLRHQTLRARGVSPREARLAAGAAALRVPGVAAYYTSDGDCSRSDGWRDRFARGFHHRRSGDLVLAYEPGAVEDFGEGRGVSYGSLYAYDTRVPLMLYGKPFTADVFGHPVEAVDVAPTLARAMRVPLPGAATGRLLDEAFARGAR